ncbi:hypothetical protein FH972_023735 [Carpinus fangiana]|uniref:Ribosomal RNA-processing protein 8 n=1 Tax=Carpinus fangiana TaxID=176857 RepID=A0A5N6KYI3_9ROSI|nr:hypothetical protein FH972_023735 [Carpinus fangiana]
MFAVPGWSLSPALLKKQADAEVTGDGASKKRKRKQVDSAEVSTRDIGDLYKQHVEKSVPKKEKAIEHSPKGNDESHTGKESKKVDGETARKVKKAADELPPVPPPAAAKLTPMQTAMRQKLIGARFRHLNQTLYTSPSAEASTLFDQNPAFFDEYHAGFRSQVESWPENPVDSFVREIQERAKVKVPYVKDKKNGGKKAVADPDTGLLPLPMTNGQCKVADLGCGDAALASKVSKLRLNVQVLSYDLAKPNKFVTKADIANLPLEDDSVNVTIFCLALMGTNWIDFIEEAWRVLHWKGELWIAEIKSRFGRVQNRRVEHSIGFKQKKRPSKQDLQRQKAQIDQIEEQELIHKVDEVPMNSEGTDVSAFVEVLRKRGFALQDETSVDLSNKMFVKMKFVKALPPLKGKMFKQDEPQRGGPMKKKNFIEKEKEEVDEPSVLKPCLYKIR